VYIYGPTTHISNIAVKGTDRLQHVSNTLASCQLYVRFIAILVSNVSAYGSDQQSR
jgi:hypothetical protein